ncbi:hypothetical protein GCK32_003230 [Trichostrongylus colubriformis]|uniref:Uncharacterized protein n=1 Tax=Trichostrongylus colubriformis TaxID=6319 RepID=A0AAN8IW85_TRICO
MRDYDMLTPHIIRGCESATLRRCDQRQASQQLEQLSLEQSRIVTCTVSSGGTSRVKAWPLFMASRKSVDKICASLAGKTPKTKKQKTSRKRPAVVDEELEEDSHEKPDSDEDFEASQSSGEATSDIELSDADAEIDELHSILPGTSKAVAAALEVVGGSLRY